MPSMSPFLKHISIQSSSIQFNLPTAKFFLYTYETIDQIIQISQSINFLVLNQEFHPSNLRMGRNPKPKPKPSTPNSTTAPSASAVL
mmetsp:Transcript_1022/g.1224  ORF Transcript_1022/g.1224 Transcript_1022/m.1224 type:complete len:87 (+) Transcript_1022:731-991(+)